MNDVQGAVAVIVGAGPGISAALARRLAGGGARVALAARSVDKLAALRDETGAHAFATDATDPAAVANLFAAVDAALGPPDIVVYNASRRAPGSLLDLDPAEVAASLAVTATAGFLVVQQAARRMVPRGRGTILLTGASASRKGFARSAPFAMGKFALRGLAQSAARELGPLGIHVAHFVIDGGVRAAGRPDRPDRPDGLLDPEAIAAAYLAVALQPRSAWSFEVDLRPWTESF